MTKTAKILQIKSKIKPHFLSIPSLEDFDYQEVERIDIDSIINQSNISLYCLEFSQKIAIFVETNPNINLYQFPFFYQAQYDYAQRLIAVTFEDLSKIAQEVEKPKKLVIIYSVGRCGSTLLNSIFNQIKNTVSFSEPGVYDQLVIMRQWDGSNDPEISQLVENCTKLLCRSFLSYTQVIKFRSYGIELADLILKQFPEAKIIFLYRDAKSWIKSAFRASLGDIPNNIDSLLEIEKEASQISPLVANYQHNKSLSYVKILTLAWLSVMERYLSLETQFPSSIAVRFKTLKTSPKQTILELLKYCDLPITNLHQVLKVLEKDSQANTVLSKANLNKQEVELTTKDLKEIRETLKKSLTIVTPDFIVPNTLYLK
ncbi:sulfotransferase domain-containing protein [Crocosphaera sp. XPORK-15E]|uniref:sulfotransferase domain-containing protein n=1 Tax=Crocosphaera sp. XPORK-15E TaxID=3110247 RepID=UPI002B21FD68|nr:sulfotransferase domain-containing protein [Crocosphaera sp. XPORK-15E]MEA5536724.1 sulfotransferase domain-containing protein [Crocosphaera sp. XPORK-15E]